ncbi:MAG: hypothetical protein KAX49_12380 [Halanaerobiales bacterium]|nr:hypothetical protein [Halanaerobiales bacterium]
MLEIVLKTPLRVGNTWESGDRIREIIDIDETVTIPAGTFYNVIKVKVITKEENNFEIYEYYAENVGLILKESKFDGNEVRSKLKSYVIMQDVEVISLKEIGVSEKEITEDRANNQFKNPELALLAYQLEHQIRSLFQSAYESYNNMRQISTHSLSEKNFDQIYMVFQEGLKEIASENLMNQNLKRLRDYYEFGEGEVSFPTHEVVERVKLLKRTSNTATISLNITKFFPKREWTGEAYCNTFDYVVDLVKENGCWKVKNINGE